MAVERIDAAAEAARTLPFRFTLTARAENYFVGRPNLDDTIRRLLAFQEAGADALFAPGLARREDIAEVLKAVTRPLNVLIGAPGMELTAQELLDMGVRRISVGGPPGSRSVWCAGPCSHRVEGSGHHLLYPIGYARSGFESAFFQPTH